MNLPFGHHLLNLVDSILQLDLPCGPCMQCLFPTIPIWMPVGTALFWFLSPFMQWTSLPSHLHYGLDLGLPWPFQVLPTRWRPTFPTLPSHTWTAFTYLPSRTAVTTLQLLLGSVILHHLEQYLLHESGPHALQLRTPGCTGHWPLCHVARFGLGNIHSPPTFLVSSTVPNTFPRLHWN